MHTYAQVVWRYVKLFKLVGLILLAEQATTTVYSSDCSIQCTFLQSGMASVVYAAVEEEDFSSRGGESETLFFLLFCQGFYKVANQLGWRLQSGRKGRRDYLLRQ